MRDGIFLYSSCGSPNYAAPELINGKFYNGSSIDIWSCGVILYTLLTGTLPFDEKQIPKLYQKIRECKYILPQILSDSAKDLSENQFSYLKSNLTNSFTYFSAFSFFSPHLISFLIFIVFSNNINYNYNSF